MTGGKDHKRLGRRQLGPSREGDMERCKPVSYDWKDPGKSVCCIEACLPISYAFVAVDNSVHQDLTPICRQELV